MRRLSGRGIAKRGGLATVEAWLARNVACAMSCAMRLAMNWVCALSMALAFSVPASSRLPSSCMTGPFVLLFDHGSSKLDDRSNWVLRYAINLQGRCGYAHAYVQGNTDTSEPRSLSRKRAIVAGAYLRKNGLSSKDITVRWAGSENLRVPTPPNTSEPLNRRVDIMYGPLSK